MAAVTTELKVLVKAVGKGELKELEAALNKLAVTARTKVDVNFKKVSSELKNIQSTSTQSIKNLRDYRNAWRDIAAQLDISSKEFKEATAEAAKLDAQLAKAEKRKPAGGGGRLRAGAQIAGTVAGAGIFGGPEGALGALIGSVGGPGGAIVGGAIGAQVGQLRQAAGGVAEYTAQLNLAKATLGGVSTNLADYNSNLAFARKISGDYGITLQGVIKGFAGVTAAARANNLTTEQTQKIYEGMAASGIAFGKSQEDLQAIFLATIQVLSKGKASAEEISGQIGERIPGAVAKFAEATNRTLPELAKAFKDGEVTIADFVLFAEKQGEDYAEFAKSLASGPEKAGIRLEIAINKMKEDYGGLFLAIGAGFQQAMTDIINFVNGNKDQYTRAIAEAIVFSQDIIKLTAQTTAIIMEFINPIIKAIKFVVDALMNFDGIPFAGPSQAEKDFLAEISGEGSKGAKEYEARIQKILGVFKSFVPTQFAGDRPLAPIPTGLVDTEGGGRGGRGGLGRGRAPMGQAEFDIRQRINEADRENLETRKLLAELDLKRFLIIKNTVDDPLKRQNDIQVAEIRFEKDLLKIGEQRVKEAEKYDKAKVDALKAAFKEAQAIDKLIPKTTELQKLWESVGDTIASSVGGALEDVLFNAKSLQESLAGIFKSLASMFLQFGVKSLVSMIPGFADGGIMSQSGPMDLKRYARGGVANSPQLAMFGEGSTPEAYVPLPDGRSIPVTMRGAGSGVQVGAINITVENTGDDLTPAAQKQLAGQVKGIVLSTLANERRSGGML